MIIRYLVFFDVTFILTCRLPLTCSAAGSCTTCLFALFQVSYALYEWLSLSKVESGCKGRWFFITLQTFLPLFLKFFLDDLISVCKTSML